MSLGVAADVPFEQPGSKLVAQQNRAGFALSEGDEMVLFGHREHAVKGIVGRCEPLLPELFPVIARGRSGGHRSSTRSENGQGRAWYPLILPPRAPYSCGTAP